MNVVENPGKDAAVAGEGGALGGRDSAGGWCFGREPFRFGNEPAAKGYNYLGIGRGAIVMSNIFLSTSLIRLASLEAGCVDSQDEIIDDCDATIRGQKPVALIANIAVVSGVLSACIMPLAGAVIDHTPYRRAVGIAFTAAIIAIQAVQIYTVESTWFPMSILQAIAGFFYQIVVMATYAYLPDIARAVGQEKMTKHTATFTIVQFSSQAGFLLVVIIASIALKTNDVVTAQVSQAINVAWVGITAFLGWRYMPSAVANHVLEAGQSLWTVGFSQTFETAKNINAKYKAGLRWFLLGTVFAEAATNAFTVVSVVYLADQIGMSGSEIGIFFLITLLGSLPGAKMGALVTRKTNPNTSWRLSMAMLASIAIIGAFGLSEDRKILVYPWGVIVGIFLGWFYSVENCFFSLVLPKGQEAELAGFFVYCTQILGWLPPLIFSALVEADVSQNLGIISVTAFHFIAIAILSCAKSWPEIVAEANAQEKEVAKEVDQTGIAEISFECEEQDV